MDLRELVFRAKLAEEARRYDEMMEYMRTVAVRKEARLSTEERNLLSVAYKNGLSARRVSWRVVISKETHLMDRLERERKMARRRKESVGQKKGGSSRRDSLGDAKASGAQVARLERELGYSAAYRTGLEREIERLCENLLSVLTERVIPRTDPGLARLEPDLQSVALKPHKEIKGMEKEISALLEQESSPVSRVVNAEDVVFLYKMKGDTYRYLVETASSVRPQRSAGDANLSFCNYLVATEVAKAHLGPRHPIRLGLALNFSVFCHQIMSAPGRACEVAKNAFDEAVLEPTARNPAHFADGSLIMRVLRDNLKMWARNASDVTQNELEAEDEKA